MWMQWGRRLTLPGSGAGAWARGRVSALPCLVEGADGSRATFPSEFLKEMLVKQTTFLPLDLAGSPKPIYDNLPLKIYILFFNVDVLISAQVTRQLILRGKI